MRDKPAMIQPPPEPDSGTPPRPGPTPGSSWVIWCLVMGIVVLQVFAARASGSVAALTALTDSMIDLLALVFGLTAARNSGSTGKDGIAPATRVRWIKGAMALSAGLVMGLVCLSRILDPVPLSGGVWGPMAGLLVVAMTLGLARLKARGVADASPALRGDVRDHSIADVAAAGVMLLGLVGGALLRVPALDAAAGLILAIWMVWGGWTLIKTPVAGPSGDGPTQ